MHNPFTLFLLLLLLPLAKPDLTSERTALLSLRSSVGDGTHFWNATDQTPCNWVGVNATDQTHLRTLSLRFNALTGHIPSDLASCTNLRNLYLQRNLLSGPIPGFLFGFSSFSFFSL